ncbi:HAD-IIIA family hydrolase [Streptomyces avermitilis]|uniref:HAD-IIIA family hydrolase n=1 Tax=Streptomyces avermitilis TaxID=33903 RepID=UPI0033AA2F47
MSGRPAVFLDRDGTLTLPRHYPARPKDLVLQPGISTPLRQLQDRGWALVVVTNQSGLARGYFGEPELAAMHRYLRELLAKAGVRLDGIYHCPHHPDGVVPGLAVRCSCRKPRPGMLTTAAAQLDIDLTASWMVGDFASDVEAGRHAGCRTALVGPGRPMDGPSVRADVVTRTTSAALRHIASSTTRKRGAHTDMPTGARDQVADLDRTIDRLPDTDQPAVVVPGRQTVSYRDLRRLITQCSEQLADRPPPDTVVGVGVADPAALLAWSLAALRRGHAVYLAPPDLPAAEAEAVAAHERAAAVVTDGDGAGSLQLLDLADAARGVRAGVHFHTSGTSGVRKSAIHAADALAAEVAAVRERVGYRPGARVLCAAPLAHAYGFVMGGLAVLAAGATAVFSRPLTPRQFARCLEEWTPEITVAVPAQYDLWAADRPVSTAAAPPRLCISAGAPLAAETAERFAGAWGRAISQQYGSSECGAVTVDLDATSDARCVGLPYPGVTLTAGTAGSPAPVVVRSDHSAAGYVGGAELGLPVNPFTADGVLTGDLGWLDELGRLHLTGRTTDVINIHGRKADPYETEAVLRRADGVGEAAVVGVDAGGDQWMAAFVTRSAASSAEPAEADLFAHCRRFLASHQVPRRFFVLAEIPRTPTGKPRQAELVELACARVPQGGRS